MPKLGQVEQQFQIDKIEYEDRYERPLGRKTLQQQWQPLCLQQQWLFLCVLRHKNGHGNKTESGEENGI